MFQAWKQWTLVMACGIVLAAGASAQVSLTPTTFSGSTPVGSTAQPVTVTLTAQASGTINSLEALTGGSPNLDFSIVSEGTCGLNPSLIVGQTCTLSVAFAPRYPGVRQGAVLALSGSQVLASAPVSGVAQGSLPVLVPGTINTVAGDGQWIYRGDGVAATAAPIFLPSGLAVDAAGDLFLCDSDNNRVRRVDATTGLISTVAGNGNSGSYGEGVPAAEAELNGPTGIAIDGAGNLYIADSGNNVIRVVNGNTGLINTFAGQINATGYSGDNGPATSALLANPRGLALTPGGDLVIADSGNNAVRLVNITSNKIWTVAGTGMAGYNGEGFATSAWLNDPYGVAVRSDGVIAIADLENQRVRLVNTQNIISTLAGTGDRNFGGDGGLPQQAQLNSPAAVAFDPAGDLFVADSGNNRIRLILNSTDLTIQTVIGIDSEQFAGDGSPSNQASLYGPYGLFFDPTGNIWLSDTFHNRVREVSGSLLTLPQYPTMKVGKTSAPVIESMYNQGNLPLTLSTPVLDQAALDPSTTTCGQTSMAPAASCTMGIEFAPTQVGNLISGSISWPSNAPHVLPVDNLDGQVLSVDVTTVALTGTPNPGLLSQPVTLTATVSSDDTGRTGAVTFSEGNTNWCTSVPINTNGVATCTISALSLGSHTFKANYSGDENNASSMSSPFVEVIKQQAALAFSVSPSPTATVASNVTLTLTAADATGTPTGSVTFYDNGTALFTQTFNASGTAQWSTPNLPLGVNTLYAQYAGDSANVPAASSTVSEQIVQASTSTVLALSTSNAAVGTPVTLTATVTNNNGPTLTGYVTFRDVTTNTNVGSQPLTSGTSSITISALPPGPQSLVAIYSGDTDDSVSTSAQMTETIEQIGTVTTLGTDANPLSAGATLHITAAVALAPGATAYGALTGSVTFYDGSTLIGAGPVLINANGQATLATSTLSVGSHALSARFSGNTNYGASTSSPLSQTVQETGTQTVLTSASATSLMGKPAVFTAVVTSTTGTPTGQMIFRDGTTVIGSMRLSAVGTATLSITTLARGPHSITATYSGDGNYGPSPSAAVAVTVLLAQPVLTLSGPTTIVDAGTPASFVANLTTPGVGPTGTLQLLDGGRTVGNVSVTESGNFSFSITTLAIGTHGLTAIYSGDGNNSSATSSTVSVTIRQAPTATALSASANPLTAGGALTLTAQITSDSPDAAGQVSFFDGPALLGNAALNSNGRATLSPTGLTIGSHALTAVYSGDTNHAGSTSTPLTELVVQSATINLTSNNNPSASGQEVTFTAQVGPGGSFIPTGTATFRDNGALLGTVPLNSGGAAVLTSSALAVGSHIVTVNYGGDRNFSTVSAQLIQTVTNANTRMTIAASANPSVYGQPLRLTASVTSNGGTATGRVTFTDGGKAIGSAPLNSSGVAELTLSTLAPGAHTIVATYAGDGKADPSASTPLSLSVKQTTTMAVAANTNPSPTLSSIRFTAAIRNAGAAPATGVISFTDGDAAIGTASLDATGHATLTMPDMSAGSHSITASYPGDGSNFSTISTVYNETVQLRPTSTTVSGSATDLTNPQQVTLIAVIEGQGSVPPGGTVTFTSGNLTLGQAPLSASGVATITVLFSQPTAPVIASYAGDANYAASQSATTMITAGTAPQFTLAVTTPSIALVSHQHATIQVNIGSVKGFTDTIALGCLGLPEDGTCTFTPSQLKLSADGTASASLVVDTGDPLGAGTGTASLSKGTPGSRGTLLCCLPFGLLLGLIGGRKSRAFRQRLGMLCMFAAAIAFAMGVSGCGGLNTNGTAAGTYTIKVVGTGQGSGITETQTITLVVTQ